MASCPSDDDLLQLYPLLGSLARLIASGSVLDDTELRTLLLGTDVRSHPAALRELGCWKELLIALRKNPALRMVTVEALQRRGLPEAPVLLAVDTIIGDLEKEIFPPCYTPRLIANVGQLNLGTLSPGQEATAKFEVQGGPGQIVVESDQLEVMPLQFGAETTIIRVKVKPVPGGVLWTKIRLITPGETLEVPVLAQWPTTQPPQNQEGDKPPRREVVVSNLAHGLEEAIRQAQTGEVLRLQRGEYRLNRSLKVYKGLSLLGEGMEFTRLVFAGEGCVLEYAGDGNFSARGIAFIHEGEKWSNVVLASSGEVSFHDCRFTGGVLDGTSQRGGSGLLLCGTVRGCVERCQAIRNQLMGIKVSGQAQPLLRGNVCQGNNHGIYVTEQAQPTIESNICQDNKGDGISYRETAGGVVRNNECINNSEDGIYVPPTARPTLHDNRCRGNKRNVCDMRR